MTHPAKSARLAKEKRPQDWCVNPRCLWHTSRSGPCPKHEKPVTTSNATDPFVEALEGMAYRRYLCMRCHVNEPISNSQLCAECHADALKVVA